MRRSLIAGVGAALPEQVVSNEEIEARFGVEAGWIEGRTGVRERRITRTPGELVDLAEAASRMALDAAGVDAGDLDEVVVATTSGPYLFPSLACLINDRLGVAEAPAFDVAAACAGFPYALTVADRAIRSGDRECVLVVGADRLSAACEPSDRGTAALFGDGAGAVVLHSIDAAGDRPRGILAHRLRALGDQWSILRLPTGSHAPGGEEAWMRMDGAEVFRAAVEHLVGLTREVLEEAGLRAEDVRVLVPHQANVRIIRRMTAQLGIDVDRVEVNLGRCGNTSAASIPLALADAVAAGRLGRGDVLVLNAVGGGMTAGAVVARW